MSPRCSGPTGRLLPSLTLALGLLAAGPAQAAPDLSAGASESTADGSPGACGPTPGGGFLKKRGYLHLAPGIMALTLNTPSTPLYAWGLSGGIHLPVTGAFMIEVGGFFDHITRAAWGFGSTHVFGLGPELRLGGGNRTIFGYGLVRLGLAINHVVFRDPTPDPGEPFVRRGTGAAFLMTLGGGIQGLVHPHVALGGEPAFDILASPGGASGLFRLRFFVSILF